MTDYIHKIKSQLYSYRLCCWILFNENGGKSITFNRTGPSPYLKSPEGLLTSRYSDFMLRRNIVFHKTPQNTQRNRPIVFLKGTVGELGLILKI